MRNLTLSLDDAIHRRARIAAAERGLSVSAFVRDLLLRDLQPSNEQAQRDDLLETFSWAASTGNFSAQDRLTREQANDRAGLRREFEEAKQ